MLRHAKVITVWIKIQYACNILILLQFYKIDLFLTRFSQVFDFGLLIFSFDPASNQLWNVKLK